MEINQRIVKIGQGVCPVCHGAERVEFEHFGDFVLYKCADCDLVYSYPMRSMSERDYAEMYGGRGFHEGFASSLSTGQVFFFKRNKIGTEKKLLDVGTSTGLFVHEALRRGFKTVGTETDPTALFASRQMFPEISVENASLGELRGRGEKFDIITLFEVLEHVENPTLILKEVVGLLRQGGKIIIFVPNRKRTPPLYREMIDRGIDFPPHHLTKWSVRSLSVALRNAGANVIFIRDIGKYHFSIVPGLGIASKVRGMISNKESLGDLSIGVSKKKDALRSVYSVLAKLRLLADKILFFPVDIFWRAKGYEKDGLYLEAVSGNA